MRTKLNMIFGSFFLQGQSFYIRKIKRKKSEPAKWPTEQYSTFFSFFFLIMWKGKKKKKHFILLFNVALFCVTQTKLYGVKMRGQADSSKTRAVVQKNVKTIQHLHLFFQTCGCVPQAFYYQFVCNFFFFFGLYSFNFLLVFVDYFFQFELCLLYYNYNYYCHCYCCSLF